MIVDYVIFLALFLLIFSIYFTKENKSHCNAYWYISKVIVNYFQRFFFFLDQIRLSLNRRSTMSINQVDVHLLLVPLVPTWSKWVLKPGSSWIIVEALTYLSLRKRLNLPIKIGLFENKIDWNWKFN